MRQCRQHGEEEEEEEKKTKTKTYPIWPHNWTGIGKEVVFLGMESLDCEGMKVPQHLRLHPPLDLARVEKDRADE